MVKIHGKKPNRNNLFDGSALMVNLRRLHAFLHKEMDKVVNEAGQHEQTEQNGLILPVYMALVALWLSLWGRAGASHKPQFAFA